MGFSRRAFWSSWRFPIASASMLVASLTTFAQGGAPPSEPAQDPLDAPANLAVVYGAATLERDGQTITAEENLPLLTGDRLRTERGRLEVLFPDGSALDVDEHTQIDLLSESLLRLRAGRVHLSIARAENPASYRIDGAGASAILRSAGEYRVSLANGRSASPELGLAVLRGAAEISNSAGRTAVRAGNEAFANATAEPSLPHGFNASASSAFDQWVDAQHDARLASHSSTYLPEEVRSYGGALERNGVWEEDAAYGYVWYPSVAVSWRPYYDGHWSTIGPYGWFWVGAGSWVWPTHHYGRWGVHSGRWFWIPGHAWGPAWVSWAVSPGYVSWCPLGYDGRAAVSLNASVYVSRAWTAVPSHNFTNGVVVPHTVVNDRLTPRSWSEFSVRSSGPGVAGSRTTGEPLRSPTSGPQHAARRPIAGSGTGPANWQPALRDGRTMVTPTSPTTPPASTNRRFSSSSRLPPTPDEPSRPVSPRVPSSPRTPSSPREPSSPRVPSDPTIRSRGDVVGNIDTYITIAPQQRRGPDRPPAGGSTDRPASGGERRVSPPVTRAPGDQQPSRPSGSDRATGRSMPSAPSAPAASAPSRGSGSTSQPAPSGSGRGQAAPRSGRGGGGSRGGR